MIIYERKRIILKGKIVYKHLKFSVLKLIYDVHRAIKPFFYPTFLKSVISYTDMCGTSLSSKYLLMLELNINQSINQSTKVLEHLNGSTIRVTNCFCPTTVTLCEIKLKYITRYIFIYGNYYINI